MTHILNDWGIGDKLAKIATPINQMTCLDGRCLQKKTKKKQVASDVH